MFEDLLGFVSNREDITSGTAWFCVREFLPEPEKPNIRYGSSYEQYRGRYHQWYKRKALIEEALRVLERLNFIEQRKETGKSPPTYRFLPGEYATLLARLALRKKRREEVGQD